MSTPPQPPQSWRLKQASTTYLTSTSPTHISHKFIQSAFASKEMYWAKPLSGPDLELLLSSSLNLGLYRVLSPQAQPRFAPPRTVSEPSSPREGSPTTSVSADDDIEAQEEQEIVGSELELEQIGFARFITDRVTTFYLTDVYVAPEYRGKGLGRWLIACCGDVMREARMMRRALLMASPGVGEAFYREELGMTNIAEEEGHVVCMTRRKYGVGE